MRDVSVYNNKCSNEVEVWSKLEGWRLTQMDRDVEYGDVDVNMKIRHSPCCPVHFSSHVPPKLSPGLRC